MTKILFLIPSLMHGGAEKVLVNLVNNLDRKKYDITLFSIFDEGINKEFLKKDIKYKYKFRKVFKGNSHFFKLFSPDFLYKWFIKDEYDIVISYLEGPSSRIISGCNNPNSKKIAWIHTELIDTNCVKIGFRNINEARLSYEKFDRIIGVSKKVVAQARKNITNRIPINVLYNVNETEQIIKKGKDEIPIKYDENRISICSAGKIMFLKGYDRLLRVHKRLLDEGFKQDIYILGIGQERKTLEKMAIKLGVQDSFKFIGFHKNPYKYLSKCDLYISPSRREGFNTAITEALILGVPVVSTNTSGAKELLGENNEYGIVTDNSMEGVYNGLKEMLSDTNKLEYYKKQAVIRGKIFSKNRTVNEVEKLLDTIKL